MSADPRQALATFVTALERHLEAAATERQPGPFEGARRRDPCGVDLDADDLQPRDVRPEAVIELERGDRARAVPEVDDDRLGQAAQVAGVPGDDPPVAAAEAVGVRRAARDRADDRAGA